MSLTVPSREFRFFNTGEYNNRPAQPYHPRRATNNSTPRRGKVCPGCGIERSAADKCECNS